jgi:hypothetical protein
MIHTDEDDEFDRIARENALHEVYRLGQEIEGQPYHFEKREWDELTLAEVKEAYSQHAKYQIEDMGVSGWVEFADAIQNILRNKNT